MADSGVTDLGMADLGLETARGAGKHSAGVVIGSTGYITTGTGFDPKDDPGSATPGIRMMTAEEREAWEGNVVPRAAEEPDVRQCRQVKENGFRCRNTPAAGETFCHHHRRYRGTRTDGGIEVPLMEDPASIRLVISQTVRAMGRGDIPPANGRAMIAGCRVALDLLDHELAKARLEERRADRLERAAAARAAVRPAVVPVVVEEVVNSGVTGECAETEEERAQEVLAAVEAREVAGEPEDAAEFEEAVQPPRRTAPGFSDKELQKQWDVGMAGPEKRPLHLHSWEKNMVQPEVLWPRPGR
jgi:hypothetical protein